MPARQFETGAAAVFLDSELNNTEVRVHEGEQFTLNCRVHRQQVHCRRGSPLQSRHVLLLLQNTRILFVFSGTSHSRLRPVLPYFKFIQNLFQTDLGV